VSGGVWSTFASILVFMLLTVCPAAAVVWGILHSLRRSGVHRLENVPSFMKSADSNDM
jgi:hypothetical protein